MSEPIDFDHPSGAAMTIDAPVPEVLSEDHFNGPPVFDLGVTYQIGGDLKPGDAVLYEPSTGKYFGGFVDSEPFWCGVTRCVSLRGMAPEYAKFKGGPEDHRWGPEVFLDPTRVKAAAVHLCYRELKQ